jgi:hypothetical protein
MRSRPFALLIAALALSFRMGAAVSVAMPVPADVQAALFHSIWKLDRNFDCTKGVRLAVIYQQSFFDSAAAKDDFVESIARLGPHTKLILMEVTTQQSLVDALQKTELDMIYVAPLRSIDVAEIGRISRARHIRTITGVPEYVDGGIAVGIGLRRDRPLIIVNLEQARAEGVSFSSQLLALARIVGPVQ